MKHPKSILLAASFIAISFVVIPAQAQSVNKSNSPQPACGNGQCAAADGSAINQAGQNRPMRNDIMPDFSNLPATPDEFVAQHPRLAKAWKFLNNESFRARIESPMSSADKLTIENAVTDAKNNIETLKSLRPQFVAARTSGDTAQIHALFHSARPSIKQIRADKRIILAIIAKYKNAGAESSKLLDPVYPNPLIIGNGGATVSYHLKNDGPVNITVTDQSGNIVKQISNISETAGDHTFNIGQEFISRPGTYYVTVEADNTKSTQKVAAVQ